MNHVDKQTMVEQASEIIADAAWALEEGRSGAGLDYVPHAEALVDAGWRLVLDDEAAAERIAKAIFGETEEMWDELYASTRISYCKEARRVLATLRGDSDA